MKPLATTLYRLNPSGQPESEVNWVEELQTWSQRSRVHLDWVASQTGDQWVVEVKFNGRVVPGVLGVGRRQQKAKEDAAKKLDAARLLTIGQ
ncbi:hypothetical protein BDV93DRAFT_560143 [Ceratobasidium sp. AG-I]|nr:hypothetical protein BDV93DRAFT_560143 [Ceratobasidium sp. AG-I]